MGTTSKAKRVEELIIQGGGRTLDSPMQGPYTYLAETRFNRAQMTGVWMASRALLAQKWLINKALPTCLAQQRPFVHGLVAASKITLSNERRCSAWALLLRQVAKTLETKTAVAHPTIQCQIQQQRTKVKEIKKSV